MSQQKAMEIASELQAFLDPITPNLYVSFATFRQVKSKVSEIVEELKTESDPALVEKELSTSNATSNIPAPPAGGKKAKTEEKV